MSAGRSESPRPVVRVDRIALAMNPRAGLGAERGLAATRKAAITSRVAARPRPAR